MKALIYEESLPGAKGIATRALARLGRAIGVWSATYPACSWHDALAWLACHAQTPWTGITFWLADEGLLEIVTQQVGCMRNSDLAKLVDGVLRVASARCVFRQGVWPFGRSARVAWRQQVKAEQRQWVN